MACRLAPIRDHISFTAEGGVPLHGRALRASWQVALSATWDGRGPHQGPAPWPQWLLYSLRPSYPPLLRTDPPPPPPPPPARRPQQQQDGGLRVWARPYPPVRPWSGEHPRPGDPRHEPEQRGLPLAGDPCPDQDPPGGREADLQDHDGHPLHVPDHGHGRLGERADEHPLPRRPHRVLLAGAVQPAVDRPAAAAGVQRGRDRVRLGLRRRPGRAGDQAPGRLRPHHQGRVHRPQRDRHGRHQRPPRRAQAPGRVPAPGAAAGGRGVVHLRAGLPHGRVGRGRGAHGVAEGAVAAHGAGHRVRQPQGAGGGQDGQVRQGLLRLEGLPQVLQDGHLLALHALHPAPLRPPRRPRPHLRGGARERHQEARASRRGNKVGRGGVGAQELHPEGGELQRHRHRRRRAGVHRQLRDCQARLEAVQPQPRPGAQQGRREGLQDWTPRQPQRAATAGLPERGGDGAQGHRVPGEARQRRGGRGGVPLEFHAPHPLQDLSGTHSRAREGEEGKTNACCPASVRSAAWHTAGRTEQP